MGLVARMHAQPGSDAPSNSDLVSLRHQLEAATGRCRGAFLANFQLDDAPDFADWVEQQRAYWQGRVDRVLNALSALQRQQGAFAAAIQTAERWIRVNPRAFPHSSKSSSMESKTGSYLAE